MGKVMLELGSEDRLFGQYGIEHFNEQFIEFIYIFKVGQSIDLKSSGAQ